MGVLGVLLIVFGSVFTYVVVVATVVNYCQNHFRYWSDDSEVGGWACGLLWPVSMWFLFMWAFAYRPTDRQRVEPFIWHRLTPRRGVRVARGTRRELERRSAVNQMERDLGLMPTQWEDAP